MNLEPSISMCQQITSVHDLFYLYIVKAIAVLHSFRIMIKNTIIRSIQYCICALNRKYFSGVSLRRRINLMKKQHGLYFCVVECRLKSHADVPSNVNVMQSWLISNRFLLSYRICFSSQNSITMAKLKCIFCIRFRTRMRET